MNRQIWLPITVAKCIGNSCKYPGKCAAREVPYQDGRPIADHSLSPGSYMNAPCSAPNWLRRLDPANAVKPVEKPQVKEWIGR